VKRAMPAMGTFKRRGQHRARLLVMAGRWPSCRRVRRSHPPGEDQNQQDDRQTSAQPCPIIEKPVTSSIPRVAEARDDAQRHVGTKQGEPGHQKTQTVSVRGKRSATIFGSMLGFEDGLKKSKVTARLIYVQI